MSFEVIESVFTINADAIMTTAMAAVMLLIGYAVKAKVAFLRKYCIPAPVVGGFLFMFVTFIGHQFGLYEFSFTTTFQDPFMLAFFTTVGLGASVQLLKKGGKLHADCKNCGFCEKKCPQHLRIRELLQKVEAVFNK